MCTSRLAASALTARAIQSSTLHAAPLGVSNVWEIDPGDPPGVPRRCTHWPAWHDVAPGELPCSTLPLATSQAPIVAGAVVIGFPVTQRFEAAVGERCGHGRASQRAAATPATVVAPSAIAGAAIARAARWCVSFSGEWVA